MNRLTCENLYMYILNMSHFIANVLGWGVLFGFFSSSLLLGARLFSSVSKEAVLSCQGTVLPCVNAWKQPSCWSWCIVHLWAQMTAFCLSSSAMYFWGITSVPTVTALLLWPVPSQSGLQSAPFTVISVSSEDSREMHILKCYNNMKQDLRVQ